MSLQDLKEKVIAMVWFNPGKTAYELCKLEGLVGYSPVGIDRILFQYEREGLLKSTGDGPFAYSIHDEKTARRILIKLGFNLDDGKQVKPSPFVKSYRKYKKQGGIL